MTFKELLEKYKNGMATPEEREQVEREMEKYEALTDYMLEEEPAAEERAEEPSEELKKIRKNLKKRNVLIVVLAVMIACGAVGAAARFEPVISKAVWYDPTEDGMQKFAYDIDGHIAVLTELTMPEVQMEQVIIKEKGQGEYDLSIPRWDYSKGEQDYTYGTVKRNEITMRQDFYKECIMNIFTRGSFGYRVEPEPEGVIKDVATAKAALAELPEYICMEAYISLKRDWSMEELETFRNAMDTKTGGMGWVGVRTAQEGEQLLPYLGFQATGSGLIYDDLEKAYPYYEIGEHDEEPLPKVWQEHFKALLRYYMEHIDFYNMMDRNNQHAVENAAEYVEENGVNTYGFVYYGTPQDLLKVMNYADVEGIYVSDYRVSVPDL